MTLTTPELCKECMLNLKYVKDEKQTDLERFTELFDSCEIKYDLDATNENLDYITVRDGAKQVFFDHVFSKTGKFLYNDASYY